MTFKALANVCALLVTLLVAAWIVDTWSNGALVREVREAWHDAEQRRPRPFATGESVVAEAIRLTREAADRPRGGQ
jgi:hypothetical protein